MLQVKIFIVIILKLYSYATKPGVNTLCLGVDDGCVKGGGKSKTRFFFFLI